MPKRKNATDATDPRSYQEKLVYIFTLSPKIICNPKRKNTTNATDQRSYQEKLGDIKSKNYLEPEEKNRLGKLSGNIRTHLL